ncbi:MAG: lysophospholipid acyltransferase family protein [Planctomycetes bacterium]|nr:lysophospholipid acyltransferase family protein [Planctomycetota bacterium]
MSWVASNFFREVRNNLLTGATSFAVRGLYLTVRFRDDGWEQVKTAADARGVIFVLWHSGLMIPLGHECRRGVRALISPGRDGEFAARVVRRFGVEAVRGSSSSAGGRALLEAVRSASANGAPTRWALTPDGPRGPRYVLQAGVAWLASRTGLPVVPIGIAAERAWHLKTWDRYRIPKPFSRVHLVFGQPVDVPASLSRGDVERQRARVERALMEASRAAATKAGVPWPD